VQYQLGRARQPRRLTIAVYEEVVVLVSLLFEMFRNEGGKETVASGRKRLARSGKDGAAHVQVDDFAGRLRRRAILVIHDALRFVLVF